MARKMMTRREDMTNDGRVSMVGRWCLRMDLALYICAQNRTARHGDDRQQDGFLD
jgi:hypothetical protein